MIKNEKMVLGFCWYEETEWTQLKALDTDNMDESFTVWHKSASETFNRLRRDGQNVKKVLIKAAAFLEWCREQDAQPNGDARSRYAAWVLEQRGKRR